MPSTDLKWEMWQQAARMRERVPNQLHHGVHPVTHITYIHCTSQAKYNTESTEMLEASDVYTNTETNEITEP